MHFNVHGFVRRWNLKAFVQNPLFQALADPNLCLDFRPHETIHHYAIGSLDSSLCQDILSEPFLVTDRVKTSLNLACDSWTVEKTVGRSATS